jgi:5-oxoprolinase (ATP-hydrolysing)
VENIGAEGAQLMAARNHGWRFWIDRDVTFTDVVARKPDGAIVTHKLLSDNPDHYADSAVEGVRRLLDLKSAVDIPPGIVETVKMGTTVATNALRPRNSMLEMPL